jgi:hypothetical protein
LVCFEEPCLASRIWIMMTLKTTDVDIGFGGLAGRRKTFFIFGAVLVGFFILMISLSSVLAANNPNPKITGGEATVCCEKTSSGLFCQDVPSEECSSDARQIPTGCESTSFCRPGFCYDSKEGTCADNTPQLVCNDEGGTWSEELPAQCGLGCCTLGDQAAFVTLVRCKRLSSFLGLKTNYNTAIQDETQCVLSVANQDKGACVFDREFERTCKFTTRAECESGVGATDDSKGVSGEFFVGKLCTSEELATNCGPTTETRCVEGKDEVYFVDTCGNPGNIYDASKVNDLEYWGRLFSKSESCNAGNENSKSTTCGNCNYLLGSFCRSSESAEANARYGDNICADLNCKKTSNGKSYRHGESWCVNNDAGEIDGGVNSVGSRFFKHICINGEEVVEACADFRQEECVEDSISVGSDDFSQAACRVNRWQDCTSQISQDDCENTDRRDCLWKKGQFDVSFTNKSKGGVCVPLNTPGLTFWNGEETLSICSQANAACIVTFEKGLFGGEKCESNCHCLDASWKKDHADVCNAIGDCGPNVNWVGEKGYKEGFLVKTTGVSSDDKK